MKITSLYHKTGAIVIIYFKLHSICEGLTSLLLKMLLEMYLKSPKVVPSVLSSINSLVQRSKHRTNVSRIPGGSGTQHAQLLLIRFRFGPFRGPLSAKSTN